MGYSYPPQFSPAARARVESSKIQAGLELDDAKQRLRWLSEVEAEVRKYIFRVFATFAQEALSLGEQGLWTVERIAKEAHEFGSTLTLEAQLQKGRDKEGRSIGPLVDRVFGSMLPEFQQELERSSEWRQFQTGLLAVARAQSSRQEAEPPSQAEALGRPGTPKPLGAGQPRLGRLKPPRRNDRYAAIDQALPEIAEARPKSHEEVFRALEGRVKVPDDTLFASAGGWMSGFRKNRPAARAWLSKAWSRLSLPPFRRGGKQ